VIRVALALFLCAAVLASGLATACLAAENRARAAALDRAQRAYEVGARQNARLRAEILRLEWELEAEPPVPPPPPESRVEVER
jgi:hypothetical protein